MIIIIIIIMKTIKIITTIIITMIIVIIIIIIIIIIISPWPSIVRVGVRRRIVMSHGQVKCSSALVGNHLEMVSR